MIALVARISFASIRWITADSILYPFNALAPGDIFCSDRCMGYGTIDFFRFASIAFLAPRLQTTFAYRILIHGDYILNPWESRSKMEAPRLRISGPFRDESTLDRRIPSQGDGAAILKRLPMPWRNCVRRYPVSSLKSNIHAKMRIITHIDSLIICLSCHATSLKIPICCYTVYKAKSYLFPYILKTRRGSGLNTEERWPFPRCSVDSCWYMKKDARHISALICVTFLVAEYLPLPLSLAGHAMVLTM